MSFCNKHKIFMRSYENVVASGEYCPACEADAKKEAMRLFPPLTRIVKQRKQQKINKISCKICNAEVIVINNRQKYCKSCRDRYKYIFRNGTFASRYMQKKYKASQVSYSFIEKTIDKFLEQDFLTDYDRRFLAELQARLNIKTGAKK